MKLTTHIFRILWLLRVFIVDMIEEDGQAIKSGTYSRIGVKRPLFFWSIVPVAWTLISRAREYRILKLDDIH